MARVEDVANGALAQVGSRANILLAVQWVNERYREMVAKVRYKHLRQIGAVVIPGVVDDGTVSVTRGATEVAADAAALSAWALIPVEKRWLKVRSGWYEVVGIFTGFLQLASPWTEEDVSGAGYQMVQRYVPIDPRAKWLGDFTFTRRGKRLDPISQEELNILNPQRYYSSIGPQVVSEFGIGLDAMGRQCRVFEFFPYSTEAETIHYVYWEEPQILRIRDELPVVIDEAVLKEGILINIMQWEMGQALQKLQPEVAATWRNEYRAQTTLWEHRLKQAVRQDRGTDDLTFILGHANSGRMGSAITTARDAVWERY